MRKGKPAPRVALGVGLVLLAACKGNSNFKDVEFSDKKNQPRVEFSSTFEPDLTTLSKFAVIRFAGVKEAGGEKINPIDEEHLLYVARCQLELLGYSYSSDPAQADFIVAVFFSKKQQERYVPPSTIWLPKYVPGQTAHLNYYGFSSSGRSYFGTATVSTPGTMTTESYTRPGYVTSDLYHHIAIIGALSSGKVLFIAQGDGKTESSNTRRIAPWLMNKIAQRIPPCANRQSSSNPLLVARRLGITVGPATVDGNEYFATVLERPHKNSAAAAAGFEKGDILQEIDGESTRNILMPKLYDLLASYRDVPASVLVRRGKKTLQLSLASASLADR